jgi:hypothetical protein
MPTASMPTSGTANYSLAGATQPTYADARTAPGTFSGSLAVNFGDLRGGPRVDGSFNVAMPDKSYAWSIGLNTGLGYSFSQSSSCGSCGCSVTTAGFFAGTAAERVGLGYHISDGFSAPANVFGAAAFKKD